MSFDNRDEWEDKEEMWEEQLTQPLEPAPPGVTAEDLETQPELREQSQLQTQPKEIQEGAKFTLCETIIYLVVIGFSIAILYIYTDWDGLESFRDTMSIAGGVFAALLLLFGVVFFVQLILGRGIGTKADKAELQSYGEVIEKGVLDIDIDQPFVQYKATKVSMRVKNVSSTFGLRVRFHSMDHVSPSSIDIPMEPNVEEEIEVELVPIAVGEREISIELANLFDSQGNLIPKFEADSIVVERFKFLAREPAFGGITASQVRLMKTLVSVATALIFGSSIIVAFFSEALGGFEEIVKSYVPMLVIFQVPVFYVYFALMNRLPS